MRYSPSYTAYRNASLGAMAAWQDERDVGSLVCGILSDALRRGHHGRGRSSRHGVCTGRGAAARDGSLFRAEIAGNDPWIITDSGWRTLGYDLASLEAVD